MAACSTILGQLWQASLTGATDPVVVHQAFMRGLGTYITSNVTASVTFVGALIAPPNTPLTVTDVVKIDGSLTSTFPVTFSIPAKDANGMYTDGGPEWLNWMTQVYTGIRLANFIGPLSIPITSPQSAFLPMITPSFSRSSLLSAYQAAVNDPQGSVLDTLALAIMSDMATMFTPAFPAIYSVAYTGVCTVNSIITP